MTSVVHLVHRLGQLADEQISLAIAGHKLTPRQLEVLMTLAAAEGASQIDITRATGIDRSTLAGIVRRLVDCKLLERRRSSADERAYAIRLTEAGRAVLAACGPAAKAVDFTLLGMLDPTERDAFVSTLTRIVDHLARQPPRPWG